MLSTEFPSSPRASSVESLGCAISPVNTPVDPSSTGPGDGRLSPAGRIKKMAAAGKLVPPRWLLVSADLLAAVAALLLTGSARLTHVGARMLLVAPLIAIMSKLLGAYDRDNLLVRKSTLDEAPILFHLATLYALIVWVIRGSIVGEAAGHLQLLALWSELFLLLLLLRLIARVVSRSFTVPERCLVIGDEATCNWLQQKLAGRPSLHSKVVASIASDSLRHHEGTDPDGFSIEDLGAVAEQLRIDRVVIRPGTTNDDEVADLLHAAASLRLKVSVLPRLLEVVGSSVEFDDVEGLPFLSLRPTGLSRHARALKRSLDVGASLATIVLLGPVLAVLAFAIKVDSPGPVFFKQRRVGRDGRVFEMLKFRTMVPDAEKQKAHLRHLNQAQGLFKISDDPRITRIGRLLRRYSLDELPQLFNVLKGEMSLVGPRPLIEEEDGRIEGWRRRRLQLTPGMTGHWQVLGSARIPMDEMVRIDYLYVTDWSLWLDFKILLRTIPYVFSARGM